MIRVAIVGAGAEFIGERGRARGVDVDDRDEMEVRRGRKSVGVGARDRTRTDDCNANHPISSLTAARRHRSMCLR